MSQPDLTYAVGDIHGRHDLLVAALRWIEQHARGRQARIIFLGDYIDRGPASRQVVDTLLRGPNQPGQTFEFLKGNHEAMLLAAVADPQARWHWLGNGGDATLHSYGRAIPEDHLRWMESLPLRLEDEHRYFVHAGLRPGVAVEQQSEDDLVWIREPFLAADVDFGKHVVHGHTPNKNGPELRRHRSNLDVGAFWTGRLCVGVFDPKRAGGPIEIVLIGREGPLAGG